MGQPHYIEEAVKYPNAIWRKCPCCKRTFAVLRARFSGMQALPIREECGQECARRLALLRKQGKAQVGHCLICGTAFPQNMGKGRKREICGRTECYRRRRQRIAAEFFKNMGDELKDRVRFKTSAEREAQPLLDPWRHARWPG